MGLGQKRCRQGDGLLQNRLRDSPAAWEGDSGTGVEELQGGGPVSQARVSYRPRGPRGVGARAEGGECGGVSWPGDTGGRRGGVVGRGTKR